MYQNNFFFIFSFDINMLKRFKNKKKKLIWSKEKNKIFKVFSKTFLKCKNKRAFKKISSDVIE